MGSLSDSNQTKLVLKLTNTLIGLNIKFDLISIYFEMSQLKLVDGKASHCVETKLAGFPQITESKIP